MTRVLLVDDDDMVRMSLRLALEAEGMEVCEAVDGRLDSKEAAVGDIDVIVTDILMPEVDGMELLRQLRDRNIKTPVIAISAGGRFRVIDHLGMAKLLGASAVLSKPIDERELIDMIRNLAPAA